jgi:hypothetical protein
MLCNKISSWKAVKNSINREAHEPARFALAGWGPQRKASRDLKKLRDLRGLRGKLFWAQSKSMYKNLSEMRRF